ncbi:MAG: hypothetical protein ACRD15_08375 [Vicinamibacterales bacterium]
MVRRRVSFVAFLAAVVLLASNATYGGPESRPVRVAKPGHLDVLYAAPGDLNFSHGPKGAKLANLMADSAVGATFTVTYDGFSAQAQAAFQAAVNIWATTISSPAPIRIRANWTSLGTNVLGSAGPTVVCTTTLGVTDALYAAALADKVNGSGSCAGLLGETAELQADFNSDFPDWEFGTSGVGVSGKYNFMTVVLHEIGHGLGFFGRFTSAGGIGRLPGNPAIYDYFAVDGNGGSLFGITSPSAMLHAQLTGDNTHFNGANVVARNVGLRPKLETHHMTNFYGKASDNGWAQGSSYSHVDDDLYTGTENGLMTFALNSEEAYTDVGPIVKGMFHDMGWTITEDVPDVPTPVSPSGTIWSTSPNFSWNAADGATGYNLFVSRAGSAVLDATYAAGSVCVSGTCTQHAPVTLTAGESYTWWVRASNASGYGPWSAAKPFTIALPAPAATIVSAPTGSSVAQRPTYTWKAVTGSTYYYLFVTPHGSAPAIQTWYQASSVCGASTCSATPTIGLAAAKAHTVWVRTWNPTAYGPWSAGLTFTTGSVPAAPALAAPSGSVDTPAPTYSWNTATQATSYFLWVQRSGSAPAIQVTYPASSVCSGTTCSVTPQTELVDGAYTWWVQGISSYSAGAWSEPASFEVSATIPPAAVPSWPLAGAHGALRPTYRWARVPSATWYRVWVDELGAAPIVQTWYFSGDVCSGSVCSVTPNVPLTPGASYRWFLQTRSSRGDGPWNSTTNFSIATTTPGAATVVTPVGSGVVATPTYTWNRVPSSTWYYLWVRPSAGSWVIQTWYRAEEICGSTTCSVSPSVSLAGGQTFYYWVQTYNDFGNGGWSGMGTFSR